jgi:hypothetical protein
MYDGFEPEAWLVERLLTYTKSADHRKYMEPVNNDIYSL